MNMGYVAPLPKRPRNPDPDTAQIFIQLTMNNNPQFPLLVNLNNVAAFRDTEHGTFVVTDTAGFLVSESLSEIKNKIKNVALILE